MNERITDEMLDVYCKRWGDSCSDAGNLSKYLKAERVKVAELNAKLDRVRGLPEKWRDISYKTTDAYTNLHGCADELESTLGDEE